MTSDAPKLSPKDLLAQLQRESQVKRPPAGAVADLPLDFSDLAPPAPAVETAGLSAIDKLRLAVGRQDAPPPPVAAAPPKPAVKPDAVKANPQLNALFDKVNNLLVENAPPAEFIPAVPKTIEESGVSADEIERLVLKLLLQKGTVEGRSIATHICFPFVLLEPLLKAYKNEQLVVFKGTSGMGDYQYTLTESGRDRARRYAVECTYWGAAPVSLKDYLKGMDAQSIAKQKATETDLKRAFAELIINVKMLERLGPAINSGRGMFLFGEPGNGKTSIAERVTSCFGQEIWIPRALVIDGEIIRVFDPSVHHAITMNGKVGLLDAGFDPRWIKVRRPTIIAGGELTMEELEVRQNQVTKICEAPLQLKSNCGTLVIDDFGRQRMPVAELLNRWIVPLEKRYDFLNLPSGKKVQVPFDQLIIFSTNLEPRDLVDGAFLRRIPYKIQVADPTDEEFRKLFEIIAPTQGFNYNPAAVEYLIETHYKAKNRPFRACQPRDLLLQVKNYCSYKEQPKVMTNEGFDFAVENYFSVM